MIGRRGVYRPPYGHIFSTTAAKHSPQPLPAGKKSASADCPVKLELQQDNLLAMHRGKLAEQFVAQEILAWHNSELFYCPQGLVLYFSGYKTGYIAVTKEQNSQQQKATP